MMRNTYTLKQNEISLSQNQPILGTSGLLRDSFFISSSINKIDEEMFKLLTFFLYAELFLIHPTITLK